MTILQCRLKKKLPALLILWMFTFLRKCSSVKYGRPFMTKGTSRMPILDRIFQLANLGVGLVAFSDPCRILEKESAKGYVLFWLLLPSGLMQTEAAVKHVISGNKFTKICGDDNTKYLIIF